MTRAQKSVLDAISAFVSAHGYSPTMREIAKAVGLRSESTVHKHTRKLIQMGLLETAPDLKRRHSGHLRPAIPRVDSGSGGCTECAHLRSELKHARHLLEEVNR